jgi:gentisate 1,2-dioxygenase
VPPGQSFQPPDIHSGDETYYIREGELTEVDHTSGQVVEVQEGEVLHIPAKTWHNAYNFTDKKLHLLNPAEGGMWVDADLEQVSDFRQKTVRYKGHKDESVHDIIGSDWPPRGPADRERGKMVVIPPNRALPLIHGTDNETKFRFFVSNDRLHVGTFNLCPGKFSDLEAHQGDEALCVLKGSLQISLLQEHDREDVVMRDAIQVLEGQKFFIPEGTRHQYFNLKSEMCEVLFIVSPQL